MRLTPIPESAVIEAAKRSPDGSPFHKVLAEAAEIRAKGNQVRFMITDTGALCVQEGVAFLSTQPQ